MAGRGHTTTDTGNSRT
ncbi:hypothetical protein E2C01_085125 [Portunus trituberculatus]|uniref:Uncharacterized protein n=1 Tax=Portunus trituberculatus TaxID=210409 RepID=A0A5B7J1S1_PORTR|nr:hypothetical protein [Portunus trituberculatus]